MKIGVKGSTEAMNKFINEWEGHALTLSLLGKYLVEKFEGDIAHIKDIPPPTADEPLYERVKRVLRRYDDHMTAAEKAFMQIFSAFRLPVKESAFTKVFRTATNSQINAPLLPLDDAAFSELVNALVERGLLRKNSEEGESAYSTHPLIRAHYADTLQGDKETHHVIVKYYQSTGTNLKQIDESRFEEFKRLRRQEGFPEQTDDEIRNLMRYNKWFRKPMFQELQPYIEIVHHLCKAGAYDEAADILWQHIYRGTEFLIIHKLFAYETNFNIILAFFPNGDIGKEPLVHRIDKKQFILNQMGHCLLSLGNIKDSVAILEQAASIAVHERQMSNASIAFLNLAESFWQLGHLVKSEEMAKQALEYSQQIPTSDSERKHIIEDAFAYLAWAKAQQNMLFGEGAALELFKLAENLEKEIAPSVKYLYSSRGVYHALSLLRNDDTSYARAITASNLRMCKNHSFFDNASRSLIILALLDAQEKQFESAQKHYDEAIKIALTIDKLDIRIEAWLGRGLFYAKYLKDGQSALSDLEQAMRLIMDSGYRIYEAQCRVALAWAYKYLPTPDIVRAKQEAQHALMMSIEMGYAWGKEDAEEVLATLA